ncbi:TPA: hypothetical protein KNG91_002070 [Serratia fonticola]|uniref:hypothetical protein n=1 Tax=Serratia fonticola TaxID=47917 RepID=UPI003AB0C8F7|nr:hypothetical protein [Serratia fonticola]
MTRTTEQLRERIRGLEITLQHKNWEAVKADLECLKELLAVREAQSGPAPTVEHQRVIRMLLGVCGAAFELADDCCQQEVDGELCHVVPGDSFKKLSDALDEIENTLPDEYEDLPNTVLQWAAVPRHALRAMLQPVSHAYTLPEGYKLVPVEPTENMVIDGFESEAWDALADAVLDKKGWPYSCRESAECVTGIFKAMTAAAPTPTN